MTFLFWCFMKSSYLSLLWQCSTITLKIDNKYLEGFDIKNYLSSFLDNDFEQLFSHSTLYFPYPNANSKVICFLTLKTHIFLNLAPGCFQYPDIQCCQTLCQLRTTFNRCNCVPFQRRWYNCWQVVPTTAITMTQLIYAHWLAFWLPKRPWHILRVIWNKTK